MRRFAFFAPLAAVLALAAAAQAEPAEVTVSIGSDLQAEAGELGEREVYDQAADLRRAVERAVARSGDLDGARIHLVLTDLKPNRPTFEQMSDRPGLSLASISIGGAAIEGEIVTADGRRRPVRYERYSHDLRDVRGYSTWQDAGRAFDMFARGLASGRL